MKRALPALLVLALASGCNRTAPVSEDAMLQLQELDAQVTELQAQHTTAQTRSAALAAAVANLEASVSELDRRVLDLSSGNDLSMTRPEVEAAVAVVKQRVGEVRQASSGVMQSLASD